MSTRPWADPWELGIHSYLAYLRDRLVVASELLTETGSVFVQIGDENLHIVRSVLDEVFGSENFVSVITFKKTSGAGSPSGGTDSLAGVSDYLIWYAKKKDKLKYRQLYHEKVLGGPGAGQYTYVERPDGTRERIGKSTVGADDRVFRYDQLTSQSGVDKTRYPVIIDGREFRPSTGVWKTSEHGMANLKLAKRVAPVGNTLSYVRYLDDFPAFPINNLWEDTVTSGFGDPKVYVVQTNSKVIQRCILMTTDPGDLVLDPTCGSGTTAVVAEQHGRRWITTDTSRVALALARTRLMSARFPYYLLVDSAEGAAAQGKDVEAPSSYGQDVRMGFVYHEVGHITLKAIANNPDLREGLTPDEIREVIESHAETEILYDRPKEDRRRVRVAGRFTVESLSPHRTLDEIEDHGVTESVQFETMILDNLRKAGVQNTFKGERLKFTHLEPFEGGEWIQAQGSYEEDGGTSRRVAVAIGPEFGTVGSEQVALAAQEATRGIPFDVLLVTGFAFDPQAWAKAKEINPDVAERSLGRLRVLLVRANPDLAMGDELLKKTGAGNLFTIFGEPDLGIRMEGDEVEVEIRGLDVYDPTSGQVRPSSVKDIAAWFIDSNYDGSSFFVRHAYFLGGETADRKGKRKGPYDSLAKVLRTEIDPDAWQALYTTTSQRFSVPATGRIAVKVINHYGDEVLQVYEVAGG